MNNDSRNRMYALVEALRCTLMVPLVFLWSSFGLPSLFLWGSLGVPWGHLRSLALPSTYLRRTFDVPSAKRRRSVGVATATRLLRVAVVAGMVFATGAAWGQSEGVYYIDNNTGHSGATSGRYYLIPADDPQQDDKNDAFYSSNYSQQIGDSEKPFLTTYKTNKDAATVPTGVVNNLPDNSVWIWKAVAGESGSFYIIHASSGKYVVYDPPYSTKTNRKAMHLLSTDSPGENAKFNITTDGGGYKIRPKSISTGNRFFNPSGSNQDFYHGNGGTDGVAVNYIGTIGLWKDAGGNSTWYTETALCQAPVINYSVANGTYTITWNGMTVAQLPSGYSIRYTEDSSDPVTDPNSTAQNYDGSIIAVENDGTTVKAVVYAHGLQLSTVATQVVNSAVPAAPTFEITCDSKLQINCDNPAANLYYTYTTDGTDPADPDNGSSEWTEPVLLPDNAKLKAIAYNGSHVSLVSDVYTVVHNTAAPTVTLNETTAEVSFGTGVTIHYTTDGSVPDPSDAGQSNSPHTITGLSNSADVHIRVVATSVGRGNSCPETVVKRPKQPTVIAATECAGPSRSHTLTFSNTEEGETYWYALSNGSNQMAPTLNTFTEYTPGSPVDITSIPEWNGTDIYVTLHAYAKDAEGNASTIVVVSQNYMLKYTEAPLITHSGNSVTITATTGATISYSIDGGTSQTATTSTTFSVSAGQGHIITATAQNGSEGISCEATHQIILPTTITTLEQLQNMSLDGAYILVGNIENAGSYTSIGTTSNPFTGYFDGAGHTISGLTNPLFGTTSGAIIHDVNLKDVAISAATDTIGAIACVVKGYTRIYNCGILPNDNTFPEGAHPTVTTTGKCAGGLVGSLRDHSRVVNCFSYADVQAANIASGIVGKNTYASTAEVTNGKYTKLRTMVVNCMFYGNITGGDKQYGVYGGELITNAAATGINSYNYYSNGSTFTTTSGNPTAYNCAFPAEERYLTQVEFHRSLLNSNRELCGWWVGSPYVPATMPTSYVQNVPKDASLMAKWVLDPNIAPYPILKPFGKYPSIVNPNTGTPWFDRTTANNYEGKQLGTLTVNVQSGAHSTAANKTLNIPITHMDTLHHDYCYRKVQLPYFNTVFGNPNSANWAEKYAGNYTENVVTGWKVLGVKDKNGNEFHGKNDFLADWQNGYNFADRDCTGKDLYDTSGRVFAQGGNYYVPNGVTEITIEAYWGKAIYVRNADASYDRVNITTSDQTVITGSHFAPAGIRSNNVNNATIQTTSKLNDALNNTTIPTKATVYDYALVLVGNVQESVGKKDFKHPNSTRGFTIMSVDLDFDEEPDYCLEWQLGYNMGRQEIAPIRFDFLPIVELGIAGKRSGSTYFLSLGCYRSKGHFEVTETAFIRFGQFEFELGERDEGPVILNGGIYDQYCRGRNGEENQHINYVLLGGHVSMPSFTPGAHVNESALYQTRHCAVNALGGDFKSFYLTGGYNEGIIPFEDNPHCYIDGGHFGTIAAAYKEGISGDVTWRINHALISEFYGGGVMAQATGTNYKIVKGNIYVVIDSSIVDKYCGGPKFGDMVEGKTVTTSATKTIFTHYYGAGNGGTNYTQYYSTDATGSQINSTNWNNAIGDNYHPTQYKNRDQGYEANYDIEVINTSTGNQENRVVNRSYYYSAQFATTNTGNVTNTLTDCIIKNNFYGAGFLGGVNGSVTSTLTNTKVYGSAYGAGYSASAGTITIYNIGKIPPIPNVYTGMIKPQVEGSSTTYYWSNHHGSTGSPATAASAATHDTAYFYTEIPLDNLGAVSNNVVLTLTGNTKVGTETSPGILKAGTGNVYGGGDQSAVTGNTTVILSGGANVLGNVYGGGNLGPVGGKAEVKIQD